MMDAEKAHEALDVVGVEPRHILRARRVIESGLRAYEQGATSDQLSEYLQEAKDALEGGDE